MPKKIKFESAKFLFLFHGINSLDKKSNLRKIKEQILVTLNQLEFKKNGSFINIYFKQSSNRVYSMDYSKCNLYIRGDSKKKYSETKLLEAKNKLFFEEEFENFINYNYSSWQ